MDLQMALQMQCNSQERKMLKEWVKSLEPSKEGRRKMQEDLLKVVDGTEAFEGRKLNDEEKTGILKALLKRKQKSKDEQRFKELFFSDEEEDPPRKKQKTEDESDEEIEWESEYERKTHELYLKFRKPYDNKFNSYITMMRAMFKNRDKEWWAEWVGKRSEEFEHAIDDQFRNLKQTKAFEDLMGSM